jgi:carbohydrate-selective porin OprB
LERVAEKRRGAPAWIGAVAVAVLALGAVQQAHAQSAYLNAILNTRNDNDQPLQTAQDQSQAPVGTAAQATTPAPDGYLFNLQVGKSVGQALANQGIYIDGSYINITGYNAGGGVSNGTYSDGDATLGINLDMGKIAGIQGAQIHFYVDDRQGPNAMGFTGVHTDDPFVYGPNDAFRLTELDWDQSLFNDHVRILVGRINDLGDFDTFDFACNFVDYTCANTSFFYYNDSNSADPVSAWGGRVTFKPTLQTYFRIAAEASDGSGFYNGPNEGWNLSMTHDNGVFLPVEFGYKTDFSSSSYPSQYDVGGFYDSGNYSANMFAKDAVTQMLVASTYTDGVPREGFWAQAAQMVYRPDMNSKRGITLFGEVEAMATGQAPIQDELDGGMVWRGPIASRPNDSLNLIAEYYKFSNQVFSTTGVAMGNSVRPSKDMTALQADYNFAPAPGISISPFYEYFINPDMDGMAAPNRVKSASEVGGMLQIILPDLLGLPTLARVN